MNLVGHIEEESPNDQQICSSRSFEVKAFNSPLNKQIDRIWEDLTLNELSRNKTPNLNSNIITGKCLYL